jgi:capsid protein
MGKKRKQLEAQLARRVLGEFEAAKQTRRTANWWTSNSGPNSDLRQAWYWLVKRHQDLADNDAYASRAIGVIVNNWIGDGIMSTPQGATRRYSQAWKNWAETPESDFYGIHDWYGNQEVGAFLKSKLFADGNKLQADEVAKLFGEQKVTLVPSEKRFARLLGK